VSARRLPAALARQRLAGAPAARPPAFHLSCRVCGWAAYRRAFPWRPCPSCGADADKLACRLVGAAPRPGRAAYLLHIWDGYGHAWSYLGFTTNLPARWAAHLAGGYDPATHRATGRGARLPAAALWHGRRLVLARVWYGEQARALEQRLKQRRKPGSLRCGAAGSLRRYCPLCNPAGWARRQPNLPDPKHEPAWHRYRPDPAFADPAGEWDAAGFDQAPPAAWRATDPRRTA
jgi:hypothetical protein